MRRLLPYIIILFGTILGRTLEAYGILQAPAWFFGLGGFVGVIAGQLIES